MPIKRIPLSTRGEGDSFLRPWLPIRLINPQSGQAARTFGLIDTGADECAFPAWLALELGHDLRQGFPKTIVTGGGEVRSFAILP